MNYEIDKSRLTDLFCEEVSRAAEMSATDQGASLYDHVHNLSQDEGAVDRFIEDAIGQVLRRFADVETRSGNTVELYLPDFDESHTPTAEAALTRCIVMGAVAGWMREKSQVRAQEYLDRMNTAMEAAVGILRTRHAPRRYDTHYGD